MINSIEKMKEYFKFYDHGWNAYIRGEPFRRFATLDWRDGWKDCQSAKPEDRKEI